MPPIRHLECGLIVPAPGARAICHCLLLEAPEGLTLIDTGFGLADVRDPVARFGGPLAEERGFVLREEATAARQLAGLGYAPEAVRHIVLTHADPDHLGGIADFPAAEIHIGAEELAAARAGSWRYCPAQWAHGPRWNAHDVANERWFGLEARPLPLGSAWEILLVPLFGHTLGHCGVAIRSGGGWLLHVGDAYYLRVELERDDHPVCQLSAQSAEDNAARLASLAQLRRIARDYADEVAMVGFHDASEFEG